MTVTKKAAVPDSSIGVDVEQPLTNNNNEIITDSKKQINQQATNNVIANVVRGGENDLKTISMEELYDTAYPPRVPIVEGLIFNGTYLFVGAPKVGKSFFMAQLGYHVSMGIPLWGFPVTKGTVYIWRWKMITPDYKDGYLKCLAWRGAAIFTLQHNLRP